MFDESGGPTGFLQAGTQFAKGDFRDGYLDTVIPGTVYIEKVDRLRRYLPEYASSLASWRPLRAAAQGRHHGNHLEHVEPA